MTPKALADEAIRAARDHRWDDVDRFLARLVVGRGLHGMNAPELEAHRDELRNQLRDVNDRLIAAGRAGLLTRSLQQLDRWPAPIDLEPSD